MRTRDRSSAIPFSFIELAAWRGVFHSGVSMARKPKAEPAEQTNICKNCRYSHYRRGEELRCRRYPPVFVYDVSTGVTAVCFPDVDANMTCGEFAAYLSS
jgi:hypothetical protein